MKKRAFILLGLLVVAQLAVPLQMIRDRENTLKNGTLFKFQTRPIDPADPFQGRYVWLAYEDDYIPGPKREDTDLRHRESVFVTLDTGPDGFAKLSDWSRTRPKSRHYLKLRFKGNRTAWNPETKKRTHKGLRFDLPFDRFYMEEGKAPQAEKLAREATRNTNCWANVRILNGKAVVEDVFAEGQSLRILAAEKE
jgi:uncharacterized membrane-anchored protein